MAEMINGPSLIHLCAPFTAGKKNTAIIMELYNYQLFRMYIFLIYDNHNSS